MTFSRLNRHVLCLGLIAATPALADCPGTNQNEMNLCAADTYQRADADLNAMWRPAKRAADQAGAGDKLLAAQRLWISYRDAACDAEAAPYQGGSIQPLIWYSCLTRLTEHRIEDLKAFLF